MGAGGEPGRALSSGSREMTSVQNNPQRELGVGRLMAMRASTWLSTETWKGAPSCVLSGPGLGGMGAQDREGGWRSWTLTSHFTDGHTGAQREKSSWSCTKFKAQWGLPSPLGTSSQPSRTCLHLSRTPTHAAFSGKAQEAHLILTGNSSPSPTHHSPVDPKGPLAAKAGTPGIQPRTSLHQPCY